MEATAHIIVKGLVQGVGFRWFVERTAKKLGLKGYVRNLYNGNVEIEVEGDRSLIEELIAQVKVGNRQARVSDLTVDWRECQHHFTNFQIHF
ncbi:MAG: acylphosphatase [candidate division KSB1 bacterium]|nr:acylphosphatase [candidate division KSB1 bacterium]MDZ7318256.1 acylphosphatase [candidate division KSB1 bacterium]MDZ7341233.1 acylphosphatase [candidate division KSB1 bacterium]